MGGGRSGTSPPRLSPAVRQRVPRRGDHALWPECLALTHDLSGLEPGDGDRRFLWIAHPDPPRRAGEIECDEALFGRLRAVRKRLADERGVPAYVIFGDATLREMARRYPATREALGGIFGVGQRKLQEFGNAFAAEIAAHLQVHPRVEFAARD